MLSGTWRHLLLLGSLVGCISSHGGQSDDEYLVAKQSVLSSLSRSTYKLAGKSYKLESYQCETRSLKAQDAPFVLVIGSNPTVAWSKSVCDRRQSQLFYTAGYRLMFLNPPGIGRSNGPYDLGGAKELAAYQAWLSSNSDKKIWGVWSFGHHVIGAARLSRELSGAKFAIFSNGIYDLEIANQESEDKALKKLVDKLQKTEGDEVYDERSVAWDPDGLPKQIFIYHGRKTTLVSHSQAVRFKDSLAASGYDVSLYLLKEQGDDIAETSEIVVLKKMRAKLRSHFGRYDKS